MGRMEGRWPRVELGSARLVAFGGLAILVGLRLRLPERLVPETVCGLKRMTGIDCPGCGMTRGMMATASGELATAVGWHPLAPVLFAFLAVATIWATVDTLTGRASLSQAARRAGGPIAIGLTTLLVGIWVWRLASGHGT